MDFPCFFNELVTETLTENDAKIGEEGIEVEVDETKVEKRKYNRGNHVEGTWVIAGIKRTTGRKRLDVAWLPLRLCTIC